MSKVSTSTEAVTLHDLAAALSDATGQNIPESGIQALGGAAPGAEVADATLKFRVTLPDTTQGFAIISGPVNPDLIGRASRNIAQTRALLPASIAAPVLPTVATGHVKGLSFALWPFRTALQDGGKISRYMRRLRYAPQICNWHIDLVGETLSPAAPKICKENLAVIADNQMFSGQMRDAAQHGLERLHVGDISVQHCLQHGDFWIGNILLPDAGDDASFFVIDWAGMNREGYPFIDLCSMLMSLRCSHRFAARQMAALQTRVGCGHAGLLTSVLNGLGHLGRNLEHFPPERYRQMAGDIFHFADQTGR